MSRALVALDALRQLTDGTDLDLVALLVEVVKAQPIARPWQEVRVDLSNTWSREAGVMLSTGLRYPVRVTPAHSAQWAADVEGEDITFHPSPDAAREHCDARLRARGWLLL